MQNQQKIPIKNKQSKVVDLEELTPLAAEIELNGKVYKLRPINLEDQVWLKNKFGEKRLNQVFVERDMESLCKIVYHQLEQASKRELMAFKTVEYDDDGEEQEVYLTGPVLLMRAITGPAEQLKVVNALLHTIGISQPVLDKIVEDEIKKKETPKKTVKKKTTKKK